MENRYNNLIKQFNKVENLEFKDDLKCMSVNGNKSTYIEQGKSEKCMECKESQAIYSSIEIGKYLCSKCGQKLRTSDGKVLNLVKITNLKSYIGYNLPKNKGESHTHRSWSTKNGLLGAKQCHVKTIHDIFERSVRLYGNNLSLGERTGDGTGPYKFLTYRQLGERVTNFGSGLMQLGLKPKDNIALYSINRTEWIVSEYGCYRHSLVPVSLYDTLGSDSASYILNLVKAKVVICGPQQLQNAINCSKKCKLLTHIVVMPNRGWEKVDISSIIQKYKDNHGNGLKFLMFDDVEKLGSDKKTDVRVPKTDDVFTICFTSGTTGVPKGVVLTHGNMIGNIVGLDDHGIALNGEDVHMSFLPLAHMFERLNITRVIYSGSQAGFFRGEVPLLVEDIAQLRPTVFIAVPRLYNKIYDKISAQVNAGGFKTWLFNKGYQAKLYNMKHHNTLTHRFYDKILFSKIAAVLGGRIRLLVTGSAPISTAVLNFMQICFSVVVVEGFGQSESTTCVSVTGQDIPHVGGNVGVPIACNEVKLRDVPEMNYCSTDYVDGAPTPRGEILYRGTNAFQGYYKKPEITKEAKTKDGWVCTGDIAMWLPNGTLKIIDRKKNIFKLSQGEYVAPEKLENVYVRSPFVAQAFVYGNSLRNYCVGVFVLDPDYIPDWAKANGYSSNLKDLVNNKEFNKIVFDSLIKTAKSAGLKGFEMVKKIYLEHELFSVENNILTPSFKLRRFNARKKYQAIIDELYA